MPPFHEIKRRTQDGFIVAVKKHAWSGRIRLVKLREDTKLTTHVMSGFHFGAKRGTTQDHFAIAEQDRIREVRVAARELPEGDASAFRRKATSQERLEFRQIQFLARPHITHCI